MRLFEIGGISFRINRWFFIVIAIFLFMNLWYQVLIVFLSILVHELTHACVARKLKYCVREIEILPFGGVARINGLIAAKQSDVILIAISGPLLSLFIACAFYFYQDVNWYIRFIVEINFMLFFLNLLPALPLDGGRALQALLSLHMHYKKASYFMVKLSYGISAIMIGKVGYDYFYGGKVNLSLVIIAMFLIGAARAELRNISFRTVRIMTQKKETLTRNGMMLTNQYIVLKTTPVKEIIKNLEASRYYIIFVVDDTYQVCAILTELQLWEKLAQYDYKICFGELI